MQQNRHIIIRGASDWLAVFAAHLPRASALAQIPATTLAEQLLALYKSGQEAWPGVDLQLKDFVAHVGRSSTDILYFRTYEEEKGVTVSARR